MNQNISKRLKTKAKTEKEKSSVKPTVINDTMIQRYLVQYNRENKIFDADDEPLWNLEHIALSYKNIIEIDNLKGLEKLQKLQLDNNIICKIQNMDHLVNLTWLDLSFNLIEKIENLEKLTKLTDLSFYSNRIQELSGMETLVNLNVFSFGNNLVKQHETCTQYLRTLKNKLQVLKMADNPFFRAGGGNEGDYKLYAIESLKNLQYLDYELINSQMREAAKTKYNDEVNVDGVVQDDEKVIDQELIDAKIDVTDGMLQLIQDKESDAAPEKSKLQVLKDYASTWSQLDTSVEEQTVTFHASMKIVNKEKMKVVKFCRVTLRDSELEAESKSINLIRAFNSLRKHKINELNSLDSGEKQLQVDDYEMLLLDSCSELEDNLMEIEMLLQDALGESTGKFRDKVMALNSDMKGKTMDFIKFVMEETEIFHSTLKNASLIEQAAFETEVGNEDFEQPELGEDEEFDSKLELLGDKEPLIQNLDQFKEYMDNQLGEIERKINKSISEEWDTIDKSISSSQHTRNRTIVKEIIETCRDFKESVKTEFMEMKDKEDWE